MKELVPASAGLVLSLALRRTRTGVKSFHYEQHPRYSVFRRFRIDGVMATNSLGQILARTDVTASSRLALQDVTVNHSSTIRDSRRGERI